MPTTRGTKDNLPSHTEHHQTTSPESPCPSSPITRQSKRKRRGIRRKQSKGRVSTNRNSRSPWMQSTISTPVSNSPQDDEEHLSQQRQQRSDESRKQTNEPSSQLPIASWTFTDNPPSSSDDESNHSDLVSSQHSHLNSMADDDSVEFPSQRLGISAFQSPNVLSIDHPTQQYTTAQASLSLEGYSDSYLLSAVHDRPSSLRSPYLSTLLLDDSSVVDPSVNWSFNTVLNSSLESPSSPKPLLDSTNSSKESPAKDTDTNGNLSSTFKVSDSLRWQYIHSESPSTEDISWNSHHYQTRSVLSTLNTLPERNELDKFNGTVVGMNDWMKWSLKPLSPVSGPSTNDDSDHTDTIMASTTATNPVAPLSSTFTIEASDLTSERCLESSQQLLLPSLQPKDAMVTHQESTYSVPFNPSLTHTGLYPRQMMTSSQSFIPSSLLQASPLVSDASMAHQITMPRTGHQPTERNLMYPPPPSYSATTTAAANPTALRELPVYSTTEPSNYQTPSVYPSLPFYQQQQGNPMDSLSFFKRVSHIQPPAQVTGWSAPSIIPSLQPTTTVASLPPLYHHVVATNPPAMRSTETKTKTFTGTSATNRTNTSHRQQQRQGDPADISVDMQFVPSLSTRTHHLHRKKASPNPMTPIDLPPSIVSSSFNSPLLPLSTSSSSFSAILSEFVLHYQQLIKEANPDEFFRRFPAGNPAVDCIHITGSLPGPVVNMLQSCRRFAAAWKHGRWISNVVAFATHPLAARVVQFHSALSRQVNTLFDAMFPHLGTLVFDPIGSLCVERLIERASPPQASRIAFWLSHEAQHSLRLATHPHASRCLARLLDVCFMETDSATGFQHYCAPLDDLEPKWLRRVPPHAEEELVLPVFLAVRTDYVPNLILGDGRAPFPVSRRGWRVRENHPSMCNAWAYLSRVTIQVFLKPMHFSDLLNNRSNKLNVLCKIVERMPVAFVNPGLFIQAILLSIPGPQSPTAVTVGTTVFTPAMCRFIGTIFRTYGSRGPQLRSGACYRASLSLAIARVHERKASSGEKREPRWDQIHSRILGAPPPAWLIDQNDEDTKIVCETTGPAKCRNHCFHLQMFHNIELAFQRASDSMDELVQLCLDRMIPLLSLASGETYNAGENKNDDDDGRCYRRGTEGLSCLQTLLTCCGLGRRQLVSQILASLHTLSTVPNGSELIQFVIQLKSTGTRFRQRLLNQLMKPTAVMGNRLMCPLVTQSSATESIPPNSTDSITLFKALEEACLARRSELLAIKSLEQVSCSMQWITSPPLFLQWLLQADSRNSTQIELFKAITRHIPSQEALALIRFTAGYVNLLQSLQLLNQDTGGTAYVHDVIQSTEGALWFNMTDSWVLPQLDQKQQETKRFQPEILLPEF